MSHTSFANFNELNIFPNPTNRILNVVCEINGELSIINSIGKTIYKQDKNSKKITLDLKEIKSGIYLIKLEDYTSKIIVQ